MWLQPRQDPGGIGASFRHLRTEDLPARPVVELALDVQGPPASPAFRTCRDVHHFGHLLESQAQGLPQALDATHLADQPEDLRRIQPLTGVAPHRASLHQAVENRLKAQRGGMKSFVFQLAVQGEVPAGVVPKPVDRLPVGDAVQVLGQADSEEEHRLDGGPAGVGVVGLFQLGAHLDQTGVTTLAKSR